MDRIKKHSDSHRTQTVFWVSRHPPASWPKEP